MQAGVAGELRQLARLVYAQSVRERPPLTCCQPHPGGSWQGAAAPPSTFNFDAIISRPLNYPPVSE